MDNQQVISTINEVIETCKDGEMGFCACAENVEGGDENVEGGEIKRMLTERAQLARRRQANYKTKSAVSEAIRIRTVASRVPCIAGG